MTNQLLTLPEAAVLSGTNVSILVDALARNQLPFIPLKGRSGDIRMTKGDVERWMQQTQIR